MLQSFGTLMHTWLYGQGGYYTRAEIGVRGDFYTSVNASTFFGGSLACYLLDLLENQKLSLPLSVIEIGAHQGQLLGDVLSFLRALSHGVLEHTQFITLEPLEHLRTAQQAHLAQRGITLQCVASPLDLPITQSVFIYCNELWDSFPCEVIQDGQMLHIDSHFKPLWRENCVLEKSKGCVPLSWQPYIHTLIKALERVPQWAIASFDYGQYGKREEIDLRAYERHRVLDFADILENLPQLYQRVDLTYDVDFKHLESIFTQLGASTLFYGTQAQTLIHMGLPKLLELFAAHMPFETYQKEAFKARALIDPSGFGERFKALIVANFTP
ncbi:SAM-dependent methyltransferase [Helicobacter salomonis]|uniref:SAM-dependent methyltransferase n=1 Tax=Helicobacter salomonis TaxID=56878 RepID=UPI000CF08FB4|nr:SAM-dependent methyltransferase [Helicobacter salomonis]